MNTHTRKKKINGFEEFCVTKRVTNNSFAGQFDPLRNELNARNVSVCIETRKMLIIKLKMLKLYQDIIL